MIKTQIAKLFFFLNFDLFPRLFISSKPILNKVWKNVNPNILNLVLIKGTLSVISSHPPCKDNNARFTTVPFKP